MVAGAQRSWSGRGTVEAVAGNVITVNPGEVHDGAPIGGSRAWSMLFVSADDMGALVSDVREGASTDMEFSQPVVRERQAALLFATVQAAIHDGSNAAAEEGLISLVASLQGATRHERPAVPRSLLHARASIDDDPTGLHSLGQLAEYAGISRFQALRGFARLTGLTPHSYVVQRRLDLARSLIRAGGALADVAAASGFADQSHLHRCFTRRYGLTPGAYAAAYR
jgi:AraC-like DNA-binding protein